MIDYAVCFAFALFGVVLVFAGKNKNQPLIVIVAGAALYFIALCGAAIHSINEVLQ